MMPMTSQLCWPVMKLPPIIPIPWNAHSAPTSSRMAPTMFAVQVLVPVILAPLIFDESWAGTPGGGVAVVLFVALALAGTVLLAGSSAVGAVIDSAHADE